jgi:hypothetical protein
MNATAGAANRQFVDKAHILRRIGRCVRNV